jgi:hypothetical protein
VKMVMEDALEDPKSSIKLTTICGFSSENKIFPCHNLQRRDGKVLVDACSAMKTLNSFGQIPLHCHFPKSYGMMSRT